MANLSFRIPLRNFLYIQKRYSIPSHHWSKESKRRSGPVLALEHFDDFYKNVFGDQWPSIRIALLSRNKFCAVVNNFSDTERVVQYFESQGAINLTKVYEHQQESLKEKRKKYNREKDLEKVLKLEQKMELLLAQKQEQELRNLYPIGENIPETETLKSFNERLITATDGGYSSANLYEFVPATKLRGKEDWIPESQHYSYYNTNTDFPVKIEEEIELNIPKYLQIFIFEKGNISKFKPPSKGTTGVSDYYLMDGASILPVLALDIKPGENVIDLCAAPGGKSLACYQTLHTGVLYCNDIYETRLKRVKNIFNEYLYDFDSKISRGEILLKQQDARQLTYVDQFDKVLVDVPCTTDRHSVKEDDILNIFNQKRTKERLKIPEIQSELLFNALKMVKPGGAIVYSTCSLSPVQNDGVVHMALRKIWEETNYNLTVIDMKRALEPLQAIYKFEHQIGLKYGHLVLPYLPANFGPMYFCKIIKNK